MPEEKAAMIVKLAYRQSGGYHRDQNKTEDDVKAVYKAHAKIHPPTCTAIRN